MSLATYFRSTTAPASPTAPNLTEDSTVHETVVHNQLLPLVIQLQKETRGRKFREIQGTLQEAVTALVSFQSEEWPPSGKSPQQQQQQPAAASPRPPVTPEEPQQTPQTPTNDEEDGTVRVAADQLISDDDPQTREPVHPAVATTLEACIAVLAHPHSLPATALQLVTVIVSKRYFSGRAYGGESASPPQLLHRLLEAVAKCHDEDAAVVPLRTIVTSPKCGVHESSLLLAFRTVFHVYLVSANKAPAQQALVDMLQAVFSRMEAYHALTKHLPSQQKDDDAGFASQYHIDSFTLFRSLCKLSSKELAAEEQQEAPKKTMLQWKSDTQDPLQLSSKILALQLIVAALNFCGEAFTNEERFVLMVRNYLAVTLLKNCTSHHTQVAFLAQKIFIVMIAKFKSHLKQEIEIFLSNVFLRVLDSPNSTFKQKALLLESLRSLCGDPVLLTQIFLHYDCDMDAMNLYKDILHLLTKLGGKVTTTAASTSSKEFEQEFDLSLAGMEVLVTILKAFLRASGLPVEEGDDTACSKLRGLLQLDLGLAEAVAANVGQAPQWHINDASRHGESTCTDTTSVASSDASEVLRLSSTDEGGSSSVGVAERIVDAFETKRNQEQNFEIGAVQFTLSLKKGLNFFIDNGFATCDAQEVAKFFLLNKDKLDKTQMGEALGREPDAAFRKGDGIAAGDGGPGFWVQLLHHYVDLQDFKNLEFDDAIRNFLSGFRLPGEAQKIDRIMEKFAERFTSQNPTVFPSADTAFILAFSVIMLNTDLHNPSIKPERRMTIESFIKNNRGIGENGADLPAEFLTGIFNRIKERPFSLKEDDAARERASGATKPVFDSTAFFEGNAFFGTSGEETKRENFKKERDEMMAVTEQLIRRRPGKNEVSSSDSTSKLADAILPSDVVKPMFDVTWGPMIGILSQVLECSTDDRSVAVCLNGFVYAVRVASRNHMSLARDTFISSLAKFTFLGSLKEMKSKNVACIRTLLSIAVSDGEYIGESWGPVLQCISQLAKLRLSASGLDADETFLVETEAVKKEATNRPMENLFRQTNKNDLAREAEESNGRAVLEAVQEVLIDKVFSSTVQLSAQSLAHFIEQLISVSTTEIGQRGDSQGGENSDLNTSRSGKPGPSIFSLQKLVEVADFNMDVRPRLVWAQVWELMADFFAQNACHNNAMVSVFAIDSLKQLSFKFLEKPELSEFNFQRLFLNPFLVVMEDKSSREDIRELVLRCVDNMIRTKSHNLRSGWKVVFSILTVSANDPCEKIEYLGLAILQRLLDEHLDQVCSLSPKPASSQPSTSLKTKHSSAEDFINLCKTSLAFVQKEESSSPRPVGLSMRALCHTAIYADLLSQQRILPPDPTSQVCLGSRNRSRIFSHFLQGFSKDSEPAYLTYQGISENDQLKLTLWRPLFEGLSDALRSPARRSVGGVGCLVPRASLLALRSILLRHGNMLCSSQLKVVLERTILPSIRDAAESDVSPVVSITSESPAVSSIDFLVDAPPLPPPTDDEALQLLAETSNTPSRSMGSAELMLEASFTDLRHGGDGDLRRAYILAQKADVEGSRIHDQPFPDSWIATTAPSSLGLLTDIATELIYSRTDEEVKQLWPTISQQFVLWFTGSTQPGWMPSEALVRTTCRELRRLAERTLETSSNRPILTQCIMGLYEELLRKSNESQDSARAELVAAKERMGVDGLDTSSDDYVETSFGPGKRVGEKTWTRRGKTVTVIEVVKLDFGAVLYRPKREEPSADEQTEEASKGIPEEVDVPPAYYVDNVPNLKVRSVAAYCLSQSLSAVLPLLMRQVSFSSLRELLDLIDTSRALAAATVSDKTVSTAFLEASDWGGGGGDGMPEIHTRFQGSAVFFMAQEASATKSMVQILSSAYLRQDSDQVESAESRLVQTMSTALDKFLESEGRDGHLVDPNTWRNAGERGGKLALYCTFFVPVVTEILRTIQACTPVQFASHKYQFFPSLCTLVRVQNDEIRGLVQNILIKQVGRLIGVEEDR